MLSSLSARFLFVDSGRRYIQPFDDLPEDMPPERVQSEFEVIKLWNRTLLRKVVAPLVLPSLHAFVQQEQAAKEEIELLVKAMLKAGKLKPLLPHVCDGQRYVFRLQPDGGHWVHEKWDLANGKPPLGLPCPNQCFLNMNCLNYCRPLKISVQKQRCHFKTSQL
ncbi:hypothetical protein NXS98_07235 [Fontisphaera persica]|uniref:hypothetical protein n=1 Tax=Fontisphaera persica TaxID=2974023 RepID=UPI0024C08F75|nr:hypothetical protein [Fontisphaera persica]WCJ60906.1 hypothetical protein NXS98_07235 [Fontisphaera persica]